MIAEPVAGFFSLVTSGSKFGVKVPVDDAQPAKRVPEDYGVGLVRRSAVRGCARGSATANLVGQCSGLTRLASCLGFAFSTRGIS